MSDKNLTVYNAVREVPKEAQKEIQGGKLKGFTDINPMWRIKVLTEQFGPCGIGWYYDIERLWEQEGSNDEVMAFVLVHLFIRDDANEWSAPIVGIGGSKLTALEKGVPVNNDEAFKMALTDALSVACKALGVGANIYWDKDSTKYNGTVGDNGNSKPASKPVTAKDAQKVMGGKVVDAPKEKPAANGDHEIAEDDERPISEKMIKRIYAIAKGNKPVIEGSVKELGFAKIGEVTYNKYKQLEELVQAPQQVNLSEDDVPF